MVGDNINTVLRTVSVCNKKKWVFVSFSGPSISKNSQGDLDKGNMKGAEHNQWLFDAPAPAEAPLFH